MNVLYHLAVQHEALVILLQETHCTSWKMLKLPSFALAWSSLSRKHGLATFVLERLKYTLLKQSPLKSETKWWCVDVDGYKTINVYKPPPTRLQPLISRCFLIPVVMLVILTGRMLTRDGWSVDANSVDGEYLAGYANINSIRTGLIRPTAN